MSFKFKNLNLVFIHIPKCGGSSIFTTLKKEKGIDFKLFKTHIKLSECDRYKFQNFNFITQIRNPYSRFYSHYHYSIEWIYKRLKSELPPKGKSINFYNDLVRYLVKIKFNGFAELLVDFNKRKEFLNNFDNAESDSFIRIVDFLDQNRKVEIFKLEDGLLWNYLESNYNIKPSNKLFVKKSTYKTIKYNQELANIVYKYFREDFKKYSYDKDSWKKF